MNTDRAKSLVFLLKFGGLWLDYSDHRYSVFIKAFQILRIIFLIVGWILMINAVFLRGLKFLLTPSAAFIPLSFDVVVTSVLFFFKIKKIEKLILECDKNLSNYYKIWEQKQINSDTQKVKYLSDCYKYGMIYFSITYVSFFVIINIVRMIMGNPQYYPIPLPFDAYLDETKQRNANFYIFSLASASWLALGVPNTIAFQCAVFYIISFSTTEINIVKEYINMLYKKDDCSSDMLPNWDLNWIVKKHKKILRINKLQNRSIALPTLVQCRVIFTLSICFVMFCCLQMIGNDTVVMVLAGIFIFILLVLTLVLCSAGDYLEEASDELFYAVCNLPWYRQSVKSRKNYLILVLQTSKTLVFVYGYTTFSLNLRSYMQTVNSSFSYFMMMKSLS